MALTSLHVQDVCYGMASNYASVGKACKYLTSMPRGDGKYVQVCTKLNTGAFEKLKASGHHHGTGDNCQGYLLLLYKKQGYDAK